MSDNYCRCSKPILGIEGYCERCGQQISPEVIQKLQGEIDGEFDSLATSAAPTPSAAKPVSKSVPTPRTAPAKNYSVPKTQINSKDAARRTLKYASLFEDIGRFNQYFNAIAAIVLAAFIIFGEFEFILKLLYLFILLILWWISYIQTSLIRGVASYFQMKASAHLENS